MTSSDFSCHTDKLHVWLITDTTAVYWIYLILFVITIFVPEFIQGSIFGLSVVTVQELTLFLLGIFGFLMFLYLEKQIAHSEEQKNRFQRELNRMTKDLTGSYSYIGEMNRKLDILKSVVLGLSTTGPITQTKENALYKSIVNAVMVMTKSAHVAIRFIKMPKEVLKDVKSDKRIKLDSCAHYCLNKQHSFLESDDHYIARSPEDINNIRACIIIEKKNSKKIEDPQLLKALASLAVFLYIFVQNAIQTKKTKLEMKQK